jgi:membrane-bound lytic murein transglycosylase D
VQAGIRRWLTDMRVALVQSHENYQYMRHLMSPAFQRNGLPEALLFGIMAKESNGKVHSGSRAGAVGPMQFMPATGRRFGLGPDATGFDTRYDPRAAADASASYLNERFAELNNSIEMSLAAYNGGEGRALRVFRETGGRNFWDADVYNQFPPETKDYVPMVIAAAWLYLHPKEYGLSFPRVDARPATLRLAQPSSIYQLTICMGNGGTRDGYMRVLRNLNPRYEADAYLPAGATLNVTTKMVGLYNRWCTQGARAELARTLVLSDPTSAIVRTGSIEMVPPPVSTFVPGSAAVATTVATGQPKAPVVRDYIVQGGETLSSIARKFQCDSGELARANHIGGPRFGLRPGQKILLEGCRD